ncbi:hypothetical protein, partial [Fulvivirga kasyanovii]
KGRKAALPISLRYHTQTPHHNLYSGWAGEGWSLIAGGVIARVVQSSDDFSEKGYIGSELPASIQNAGPAGLNKYLIEGYDTHPDQFYYTFPGRSGKFFLGQDGTVIHSGFDHLDFELPANELETWEVKDHSGIVYRFGGAGFVEYAKADDTDNQVVTAWFIREIIYPNGETISFIYDQVAVPVLKDPLRAEYHAPGLASQIEVGHTVLQYNTPYLKKITLNSGLSAWSAQFASAAREGSEGRRLKSIHIYKHAANDNRKVEKVLKHFEFQHEQGPQLWLEKISEHRGSARNAYAETKFTYFDKNSISRDYGSTDYWGYYNSNPEGGAFPNVTFNSLLESTVSLSGVSKKPSASPSGLLKEIAYSLGRKVVYTYEPHDFKEALTDAGGVTYHYGGGHRIAKIESHDGTGSVTTTTYKYKLPDGTTSGTLQVLPLTRYAGEKWYYASGSWTLREANIRTSLIDNYWGLEPVVSYKVIQTEETGSGMHKFEFYNEKVLSTTVTSEGYNNTSNSMLRTPLDFLYGKVRMHEQYAREDNTYRLISSTNYEYEIFEESHLPVLQLTAELINEGDGGIESAIREIYLNGGSGPVAGHEDKVCGFTYKQLPVKKARLDEVSTREYGDEGNSRQVSSTYSYTSDNYPKQVIQHLPGNITLGESYTYAADYPGIGFCDELIGENIKSAVIESHTTRTDHTGATILNGQVTEFKTNDNELNGGVEMVPAAIYRLERAPEGGVDESEIPSISTLNYKKRVDFTYDGYGNLITTLSKGDKHSIVWDQEKILPVAQVSQADASDVYYNGFETCCHEEAKAGLYSHEGGSYTIPFTPQAGKEYELSYWYLENGEWHLYTGPFSATINKGEALDEIKVYPAGSTMTTTSYNDKSQVITRTDLNNHLAHNEYDEAGSLVRVRDKDENILQQFSYHNHYLPPCEDPTGTYPITANFQLEGDMLKVIADGGCGKLRYNWSYINEKNQHFPLSYSGSSISTKEVYTCEAYYTLKCTVTDERALNSKTIYYHVNTDAQLPRLQMDEFEIFYGEKWDYCPGDVIKVYGTARNGCGSYHVKWQFREHQASQFTTIATGQFVITYTFQGSGTLRCAITDDFGNSVYDEVFLKGKRSIDCEEF